MPGAAWDAATCHDLNRGSSTCSLPGSSARQRSGVAAAASSWPRAGLLAPGQFAVFGGATGKIPDFPSLPRASCFGRRMAAPVRLRRADRPRARRRLGQRIEIPLSAALICQRDPHHRVEKQAPMRGGVVAPGSTVARRSYHVLYHGATATCWLARITVTRPGIETARWPGRPAYRSAAPPLRGGEAGQPFATRDARV